MKRPTFLGILVMLSNFACANALEPYWSSDEFNRIQSLSLAGLPALRPDPSNRVSDDPAAAVLGKALFFDTRFSINGSVSCGSCHQPDHQFQDDLPVGQGVAEGSRRTMPIAGTAYHPFLFWDGRKDSQWSQALGPLENSVEHGADRMMVVHLVTTHYRAAYQSLFGALPDLAGLPAHAAPAGSPETVAAWQRLTPERQGDINRAFANVGKAIAAFERTIDPPTTRFDAYAAALAANDAALADKLFTEQERNGLKLFMGKGNCVTCHSGPLLTDKRFHNIGLPGDKAATDSGRSTSVFELQQDPFNCLGEFSDAQRNECAELKYMEVDGPKLIGAFKSPSLRGVTQRPPFTHAGAFATMHDLLVHYNKAPKAAFGESELKPLELTEQQLSDLDAFMQTLSVGDPTEGEEAR